MRIQASAALSNGVSRVRPSRRPPCPEEPPQAASRRGGLLRMRSFLMPSKKSLMLRSAQRASLEARTVSVQAFVPSGIGRFPRRLRAFEDVLDHDRRGQGRLPAVLIRDLGGDLDLPLAAVDP